MLTTYMLILILGLQSTRGKPIKPELSSFTAEVSVKYYDHDIGRLFIQ